MKPPLRAVCSQCSTEFLVPSGSPALRNTRYRYRKFGVAYCSSTCSDVARAMNISGALRGRPANLEVLLKAHAAIKDKWKNDVEWRQKMVSLAVGRKASEETLQKKSFAGRLSPKAQAQRDRIHKRFKGENSPHWKGGITPAHQQERNSLQAKKWRKSVFQRDDYTCQFCGVRGGELHADHIQPFSIFPLLRWVLSNGRTLCKACHRTTPTYGYSAAHRQ